MLCWRDAGALSPFCQPPRTRPRASDGRSPCHRRAIPSCVANVFAPRCVAHLVPPLCAQVDLSEGYRIAAKGLGIATVLTMSTFGMGVSATSLYLGATNLKDFHVKMRRVVHAKVRLDCRVLSSAAFAAALCAAILHSNCPFGVRRRVGAADPDPHGMVLPVVPPGRVALVLFSASSPLPSRTGSNHGTHSPKSKAKSQPAPCRNPRVRARATPRWLLRPRNGKQRTTPPPRSSSCIVCWSPWFQRASSKRHSRQTLHARAVCSFSVPLSPLSFDFLYNVH